MATKKDLVEAYAFSRRRLVTAFTSGAPGGREVEPAKPGRAIVAGVALAVLLLAGAMITGVFHGIVDPEVFEEPGFLVDEDTGALYVVLPDDVAGGGPRLRPISNPTSARLILGPGTKPQDVPGDEIARQEKGDAIGIDDAPTTVPAPGNLFNTGWTACTSNGRGVRVDVRGGAVGTPVEGQGFVVSVGQRRYLIAMAPAQSDVSVARAYQYAFPADAQDQIYTDLGVNSLGAIEVPPAWLALFPVGGSLDATGLGIQDAEKRYAGPGEFGNAKIGDRFEYRGHHYVLTKDGPAELSAFAGAVLQNSGIGNEITVDESATFDRVEAPYAAARWPEGTLSGSPDKTTPLCAVLDAEPGRVPGVQLATGESHTEVEAEPAAVVPDVMSGHGAVVWSGGWDSTTGEPHLVDERGSVYPLGPLAVTNLGYDDVAPTPVPQWWLDLFADEGPELSRNAALCPPRSTPAADQCQ